VKLAFSAILGRRDQPPADATGQLEPDERVVGWALTEAGPAVVATQRGLWLPYEDGYRRIGWHEIDKATWADDTLTVIEGKPVGDGDFVEDLRPVSWALAQPRDIPKVVRARVDRSVAVTEHHDLRPTGGVRIVGRRVSGQDGLSWLARCDAGTNRRSPEVQEQVAELLAEARARFAPRADL
jgi:hypothetical protein